MDMRSSQPTFSIVIETENLANAELSDLEACLDSIAAQPLDRRRPNEVIIVESGQMAHSVLDDVRAKYPWLTVHISPRPLHYYEAKLAGVRLATGEVVVFADSDLVYEAGWLEALLEPFGRSDTSFVSGETRVDITGLYTFSVATTWLFPRRYASNTATSLIANNAAVRRSALLACPFPIGLPLFRAQIVLHGRVLRAREMGILNVRARGVHAPPAGAEEWALRYAIAGADAVRAGTYVLDDGGNVVQQSTMGRRAAAWLRTSVRKVVSSFVRTTQALVEAPGRVVYSRPSSGQTWSTGG
jgi:glycosyltransferase involved in cell wall biosynthesis